MRALIVIITTIFALAFDSSFTGILTLRSVGSITPLAMPCLVVFIALFAPETIALLVALLLGALVDLSPGYGELVGGAHLIGPHALGYLVTALLVLRIRNVVFRRRVITIAVLTTAAVIVTGATEALVLLVRGILPWTPALKGGGFSDLIKLFGTAIYTGILAVPLGWCLLATIGLWKFHSPTGRSATWR
jgi:cell shape-determining protein MreD